MCLVSCPYGNAQWRLRSRNFPVLLKFDKRERRWLPHEVTIPCGTSFDWHYQLMRFEAESDKLVFASWLLFRRDGRGFFCLGIRKSKDMSNYIPGVIVIELTILVRARCYVIVWWYHATFMFDKRLINSWVYNYQSTCLLILFLPRGVLEFKFEWFHRLRMNFLHFWIVFKLKNSNISL